MLRVPRTATSPPGSLPPPNRSWPSTSRGKFTLPASAGAPARSETNLRAAGAKVAFRLRETRGPSSPVDTPLRECTLAPRPPHIWSRDGRTGRLIGHRDASEPGVVVSEFPATRLLGH
ncbi:hypothetical protein DPMN_122655 [Dreissena polymorpha]|uniref:Uncharacterized protein n=1 Tax=Dreissena polymorpha TaxID=45954 RepID=A0A9D4GNY8_DREPO|nr:hypothetical protein DPMN_122655 [Dreissena polymorpha]